MSSYRNTDEFECSLTERLLPPVLCRTLGRCWTFSWVRGDTGDCWWLYCWGADLPLLLLLLDKLCSVPGKTHNFQCWKQRLGFSSKWSCRLTTLTQYFPYLAAILEHAPHFPEIPLFPCHVLWWVLCLFPFLALALFLGRVHDLVHPGPYPARGAFPARALKILAFY